VPPTPAFAGRPRLGALLLTLGLLVVVTVVVSATFSPLLYRGLEELQRYPFQRVLRRVAMLVAIALLAGSLARMGVRSFAQLGLGLSRSRLESAIAAFAIGLAAIAVLFVVEIAFGFRIVGHQLAVGRVIAALGSALAIGLVEEGVFRGGLLFPFGRLRGARLWIACAAIAAVYSTAHFARGGGSRAAIDWASGWQVWAQVPPGVARGFESWTGLFATGVLFYALAYRQGHAWGAVGLHAGAVLGLQTLGDWSGPIAGKGSLFFADGILPGFGTALLAPVAAAWLLRPLPAEAGPPGAAPPP